MYIYIYIYIYWCYYKTILFTFSYLLHNHKMIGVAMFIHIYIHIYTYIYTYIYMFIIFTPMMAFILMLISLNIVCKAIVHHPQTHHINGFYKPSSDIGGSSFLFVPLFKDISFHVFFVCENMSFIAEQNF